MSTGGLRLLSLAPMMSGADPDTSAHHFDSYQWDLREAAAELGHDVQLVARSDVPLSPGLLPILPAEGGPEVDFRDRRFIDAVEGLLGVESAPRRSTPLVVVRFEGRLLEFRSFVDLAVRHPDVVFIWNLFSPNKQERPLAIGRRPSAIVRERTLAHLEESGRTSTVAIPANLVVLSDTRARSLTARSLGLPFHGVWPLHSRLAAHQAVIDPETGQSRPSRRPRILIPLAKWQSDPSTRFEVSQVIRAVNRISPPSTRPDWVIAGAAPEGSEHLRWMRAMARRGVAVHPETASLDDYAERFRLSDAVWLPRRDLYAQISSGKALDALASGSPIVAPAGSFGAIESGRWLVTPPTYVRTAEAIGLFVRASRLLPLLRDEIRPQLTSIRAAYSPQRAVAVLVDHARAALGRSSDPATPSEISFEAQHPHSDGGRLSRTDVLGELYLALRGVVQDRRASRGRG